MLTMFPTVSGGDGRIRRQYLKERDGQGGGLKLKRVACGNCGFPGVDLVRHNTSGGTLDGSGALGPVTLQSNGSGTQQEADGNQTYRNGGGCPLCGSANALGKNRFDEFSQSVSFPGLR